MRRRNLVYILVPTIIVILSGGSVVREPLVTAIPAALSSVTSRPAASEVSRLGSEEVITTTPSKCLPGIFVCIVFTAQPAACNAETTWPNKRNESGPASRDLAMVMPVPSNCANLSVNSSVSGRFQGFSLSSILIRAARSCSAFSPASTAFCSAAIILKSDSALAMLVARLDAYQDRSVQAAAVMPAIMRMICEYEADKTDMATAVTPIIVAVDDARCQTEVYRFCIELPWPAWVAILLVISVIFLIVTCCVITIATITDIRVQRQKELEETRRAS
jgi:hypothetical protein